MAKIFISTVFGYANKGDWALFNSLKRTLESLYGKCEISATCKNANLQSKYIKDINWIEQLGSSNLRGIRRYLMIMLGYVKSLCLIMLYPISQNLYVKALKSSDIIIACPGGYLHDANHSIVTLIFNFLLCLRSKKKFILAPQSIGPVKSKLYVLILKKILKRCDYIFTRETYSYDFCIQKLGLDKNKISNVMDMAFYDRTILHSKFITELPKRFIATTLIHWLYPNSKSPNTEYIHYLDELSKFYIKIVTENDLDIIVLKQIEDFGDRIGDDLIYEKLAKRLPNNIKSRVRLINEFLSPEEMKGVISKADAFIGSRMHSNIFALTCGIPVIAISYQPKTEYIMKSLGLGEFSIPINEISEAELSKKYRNISNYPQYFELMNQLSEDSKNKFISKIKEIDVDGYC